MNDLAHSHIVQSPDNPRLKVEILLLDEHYRFTIGRRNLEEVQIRPPEKERNWEEWNERQN